LVLFVKPKTTAENRGRYEKEGRPPKLFFHLNILLCYKISAGLRAPGQENPNVRSHPHPENEPEPCLSI
jgi:hypothetical protein